MLFVFPTSLFPPKNLSKIAGVKLTLCNTFIYMLWFNFILGSYFIFLCFKLIIIHYNTQKQKKIKFEPRIKLNHNITTHLFIYYKLNRYLMNSIQKNQKYLYSVFFFLSSLLLRKFHHPIWHCSFSTFK